MRFYLGLSLALMLSVDSFAFTLNLGAQNQPAAGWQKNDLAFDIDTSCASYRTKVEESINAAKDLWSAVPTTALQISVGKTVTLSSAITTYVGAGATSYAPVGNPIVYCDTNFSTTAGVSGASIPGYAGAFNMQGDGKLVGALLVLNVENGMAANITTLNTTLLQVVLSHEIGHVLGIGHSADTTALMYYQTGVGRQLVLAKDDADAITYLYPRAEPGSGGFFGCGTLAYTGGSYIKSKVTKASNDGSAPFKSMIEFGLIMMIMFLGVRVLRLPRGRRHCSEFLIASHRSLH